ncbi:MAG: hypothetical protein H7Y07_14485, partial [Pyrinomonadaceae bacterium]|nr:hypothetical protein [Sphingobacteriaceae bacterium]
KIISGNSLEEIWQQIEADFTTTPDLFEYNAVIEQQGRSVMLDIDIDLGGGFEGGYALTRFVANLKCFDSFRFALHRQDFIDGIGKFLGMEDVVLGYPEFDKKIVVKTNEADRLKDVLADDSVRKLILSFDEFNMHIGHHYSSNTEVESAFLELRIDDGITDVLKLREIYAAFMLVLSKVDLGSGSVMDFM